MKYSALLLAIFVLVAVSDASYLFEHNKLPCKWNVDISVKSLLYKYKVKIHMYDKYIRYRTENYNDVIVSDTIFRPDAVYVDNGTQFMTKFFYNGETCSHCDHVEIYQPSPYVDPEIRCAPYGGESEMPILLEEYKKDPLKMSGLGIEFGEFEKPIPLYKLFGSVNFSNYMDSVEYEGEKYKVYYENITESSEGRNNMDIFAMYVDSNNRIAFIVTDNDRPGVRTEYKFKYSIEVEPKDFIFKGKYIWNCSRPEVMKEPTQFDNAKCSSASVARVALVTLLASLLCALLF